MSYEVITVDWNKEQTRIWRHWIAKNCPTAKVYTIPDRKPFPWCWSGAKVDVWLYGFKGRRIIYLDTDTIVTRDLEGVFDLMGDAPLGVSQRLKDDRLQGRFGHLMPRLAEAFEYRMEPPNISTGMVVCNNFDPELIYGMWAEVMHHELFVELLGKHMTTEEYAIAIACAKMFDDPAKVWDIPHEIHGNIYKKNKNFGEAEVPWVMHYHRPGWAKWHGIEEWLNV